MKHLAEHAACRCRGPHADASGAPAAHAQGQARGGRRPPARRAPPRARRRRLRRARRAAGAPAPRRRRLRARRSPTCAASPGGTTTVPVGAAASRAAPARADGRTSSRTSSTSPRRRRYAALPRGAIHGDLFRDNVMFDGKRRSPACSTSTSPASTACCSTSPSRSTTGASTSTSGRLAEDRAEALRRSLRGVRPLESAEVRLLPALMRAAAFRFWLSRLWDLHLPRDADAAEGARPDPLRARAACSGATRPGIRRGIAAVRRHEAAARRAAPRASSGSAGPSRCSAASRSASPRCSRSCLFVAFCSAWIPLVGGVAAARAARRPARSSS